MSDRAARVLVVEDHELVAYALTRCLDAEDDTEVVAATGDAAEALALLRSEPVDVVVLDRRLDGGVDSLDVIPDFLAVRPDLKIMMLSGSLDDRAVTRSVEAGCMGYLLKSQSIPEIVAAVLAVARGEMAFAPPAVPMVMRMLRPGTDVLSDREVEVLQLLANGAGTDDIAEALFLSSSTVRNHVHRLIQKLGARSRLEAVSIGIRRGLVDVA